MTAPETKFERLMRDIRSAVDDLQSAADDAQEAVGELQDIADDPTGTSMPEYDDALGRAIRDEHDRAHEGVQCYCANVVCAAFEQVAS